MSIGTRVRIIGNAWCIVVADYSVVSLCVFFAVTAMFIVSSEEGRALITTLNLHFQICGIPCCCTCAACANVYVRTLLIAVALWDSTVR